MVSIARFPYEASVGANVIDTFNTVVNEGVGGQSGRISQRATRMRNFTMTINPDEAAEVRKLYDTHRMRWPVAVRDHAEYSYTDEALAYTDDGSFVYAPLRRKIMPATGDRYRYARILVPDEDEVDTVIKINGVTQPRIYWDFADLDQDGNLAFGIVKIAIGFVPTLAEITATGNDLVPVCFTEDITLNIYRDGLFTIPDVKLREILEPEMIALMGQTDDSG